MEREGEDLKVSSTFSQSLIMTIRSKTLYTNYPIQWCTLAGWEKIIIVYWFIVVYEQLFLKEYPRITHRWFPQEDESPLTLLSDKDHRQLVYNDLSKKELFLWPKTWTTSVI